MPDGLGATLRRARNRRGVSLVEVEAAIKIRVRYLQAIEEEHWETLPGGSYGRGFIRTYAAYLGLDAELLADRYAPRPEVPEASPRERRSRRPPRAVITVVVVAGLLAVAIFVGTRTGGGGGGPAAPHAGRPASHAQPPAAAPRDSAGRSGGASLRLAAKAEVWVCVVDAKGRALVAGRVLPAGSEEGPFHSGSFRVAFGNGEVAMKVDGEQTEIPASASPLGYAISAGGRLRPLSEGERPACL